MWERYRIGSKSHFFVAAALTIMTILSSGCSTPDPGTSFEPIREPYDSARTKYIDAPDGPSTGQKIAWYLPDRFLDLLDIFTVQVAIGPGAAIDAHFTALIQGSAQYYEGFTFGLDGRGFGLGYERHVGEWGFFTMRSAGHRTIATSLAGTLPTYEDPNPGVRHIERNPRHLVDLYLGVHLAIAGARVGLSFAEFIDFIGGFGTWDPSGDDLGVELIEVAQAPLPIPTMDRFIAALDNLDFLQLRSCVIEPLWRNTWVKKTDGSVYFGSEFEKERAVGKMDADGRVPESLSAQFSDVPSSVNLDTISFVPQDYRDSTDGSFNVRFDTARVQMVRGVPEFFEGQLIAYNSKQKRNEYFNIRLRIHDSVWKIERIRTAPL